MKFGQNVFPKVRLQVGAGLSEQIDFAVANGKPLQLAQAWSFQLPDEAALTTNFRSWAWSIKRLRNEGGRVRMGSREEPIPGDIPLEVVAILPEGEHGDFAAWSEAQETFDQVDARWTSVEEVDGVSQRAKELIAA